MTYTRGGRPSALIKGQPLIVENLSLEGMLIKTFTKTDTVPKGFFQIRGGIKVQITKEEYEKIKEEKSKK